MLKRKTRIADYGEEEKDYTKLIGTGMKVKLENNGHTYDTLEISVLGDIAGAGGLCDSYSNAQDLTALKNYILEKPGAELEGVKYIAADINRDSYINAQDLTAFKNYILEKTDSYLD